MKDAVTKSPSGETVVDWSKVETEKEAEDNAILRAAARLVVTAQDFADEAAGLKDEPGELSPLTIAESLGELAGHVAGLASLFRSHLDAAGLNDTAKSIGVGGGHLSPFPESNHARRVRHMLEERGEPGPSRSITYEQVVCVRNTARSPEHLESWHLLLGVGYRTNDAGDRLPHVALVTGPDGEALTRLEITPHQARELSSDLIAYAEAAERGAETDDEEVPYEDIPLD